MTINFQDAYKALEAAKAAAEKAKQELLSTGKVEVIELAQEQLSKAVIDFRQVLKREIVEVSEGKILFIPEYNALIKLAVNNNIDPAKVLSSKLVVSSGRIIEADLGYLKFRDISALLDLAKLESLTILGNYHHRKKAWGKVDQILKSRGCAIKIR